MDADGLGILNEFRERGVKITSMFMDLPTYQRYRRYGTNDDRNDKPLNIHTPDRHRRAPRRRARVVQPPHQRHRTRPSS